jgi:hypothetical protein
VFVSEIGPAPTPAIEAAMTPQRALTTILWLSFAGVAGTQDTTSTASKPQTLFGLSFLKAAHFDLGAGAVPYLRYGSGQTTQIRVSMVFNALPDWTFAVGSGGIIVGDTTSYVAPGSNGYHPFLGENTTGVEVQRRWNPSALFHPMATVGLGTLRESYQYVHFSTDGGSTSHRDNPLTTTYFDVAAGGELNLTGWMRLTPTAGYRQAAAYALPTGTMRNSGLTITSLLEFGRF